MSRILTYHSGARHLSKFWANKSVGGAKDDVSLEKILGS
jgi:cysteine synthase A